ncbi:MAG TPA: hypothetical protein VK171_14940 [Fimbriimonas sp.]|nr:hypothetical protein [Fimbriimonas sp.]
MAKHIEEAYKEDGVPEEEAESRAWATVNKQTGGGRKRGGSGQNMPKTEEFKRRSEAAKRAWQVRRESGNRTNR